jgi:3-isopropylmalate/(R)-2-methylmalate dehydratase large subunit
MAEALFRMGLGEGAKITDPASVFAFRDHLTFLDRIMPEAHVKMGLKEQAASLATVQETFSSGGLIGAASVFLLGVALRARAKRGE